MGLLFLVCGYPAGHDSLYLTCFSIYSLAICEICSAHVFTEHKNVMLLPSSARQQHYTVDACYIQIHCLKVPCLTEWSQMNCTVALKAGYQYKQYGSLLSVYDCALYVCMTFQVGRIIVAFLLLFYCSCCLRKLVMGNNKAK